MSLIEDSNTVKIDRDKRTITELKARITLLEQALSDARTARSPKPLPKAKAKYTHGDIVRVIVPDSHGSSIEPKAAAALIADLRELNPHETIFQGDHVDCGGFLAQHHTMGYVAETLYSYEEDTAHTNQFLDRVQEAASRSTFDYLEGNHEERIERWCVTQTLRHAKDAEMLRKQFAPQFMLRLETRGIAYRRTCEFYDGLTLPGTIRRGACYFTHGFSTAKNAAAAHLAKIAGNIVFAHTHRAQVESSKLINVGTVYAWGTGCLCKLQPLWQHTNPTSWTHAYAVQFVDRKTGYFFHVPIPIVDGVSMFRPSLSPSYVLTSK